MAISKLARRLVSRFKDQLALIPVLQLGITMAASIACAIVSDYTCALLILFFGILSAEFILRGLLLTAYGTHYPFFLKPYFMVDDENFGYILTFPLHAYRG